MTDACKLGCPASQVLLMDFCGAQTMYDVSDHVTFMRWGRELDNTSEVKLTVHLTGDASGRGCCEAFERLRTWRNEVMIVREDGTVWGPGTIVTIEIQRHIAHITARDAPTAWLGVRLVHNDYDFVGVDLATIAETVVVDALTQGDAAELPADVRDACILDYATFTQTGKSTDLEVKANRQTAYEVLKDLASRGLDFTVVNRSLHVGADFGFGPIGPLRDQDFSEDLKVSERGLAAATKWYVSNDNAQGSCGGVDPFYGLIERGVEGEASSTSPVDMGREACDRLAASDPPPLIVTVPSEGQLSPDAPVCPKLLVPGTLVDLAVRELCRPATVRERLTSVQFTVDDAGEHGRITLAPLGELSEPDEEG